MGNWGWADEGCIGSGPGGKQGDGGEDNTCGEGGVDSWCGEGGVDEYWGGGVQLCCPDRGRGEEGAEKVGGEGGSEGP